MSSDITEVGPPQDIQAVSRRAEVCVYVCVWGGVLATLAAGRERYMLVTLVAVSGQAIGNPICSAALLPSQICEMER
jgi:hypothetical protein